MCASALSKLRHVMFAVFLGLVAIGASLAGAGPSPTRLPSWNDGAAKKSITDFVARVTTQGGADFVPAEQRIATFDNDGTLWTEQPIYFQLAFAFDRVKAMAPQHPEWKTKQPFKALLDRDMKALAASGEKGLLQIVAATHTGMTTEEFAKTVLDWMATARHPRFNRPYNSWSISRCWNCSPICAPTASRPSSSPAAASSSCGPGSRRPTAFRRSRWSARPAW